MTADDEKKKEREALAEKLEDWRWQVAECFGAEGITDEQKRRLLSELDASIEALRGHQQQTQRSE